MKEVSERIMNELLATPSSFYVVLRREGFTEAEFWYNVALYAAGKWTGSPQAGALYFAEVFSRLKESTL